MPSGRTVALYGLSGTGKTTQVGEHAKFVWKTSGKRTEYYAADMGGFDAIEHLAELGILLPRFLEPDADVWTWINDAVTAEPGGDVGARAIDSATSVAESLLAVCAKAAAAGQQIGQQKVFTLTIPTKSGPVKIGMNNESQYGLVQGYMLDMMRRSTWTARRTGVDFLWTFGEHRAENPNDSQIIGPRLVGKALTGSIPKELRYTLRMVSEPQPSGAPLHQMWIQEKAELNGNSFGNARFPLAASTVLPAMIEPASISKFWELVDTGKAEALQADKAALGL